MGNGERDNALSTKAEFRVYLSGPMSGYPEFNFPAFHAAASYLRVLGHDVFNPAEQGWGNGDPSTGTVGEEEYLGFMREDIRQVAGADLIVLLEGWRDSRGATFEMDVASRLKIPAKELVWSEDGTRATLVPVTTHRPKLIELDETSKQTNPKDAVGSDKLPLHLWPESATVLGCLGLLEGMLKYGRSNWREAGVRASIYVDALRRHVGAWFEGENCAPDSGLPHLAHALACLAILVDAEATGQLRDDRQYRGGGYRELVEAFTPDVARLKAKYADKAPHHYTIEDGGQ